jgi:hypothetical protein
MNTESVRRRRADVRRWRDVGLRRRFPGTEVPDDLMDHRPKAATRPVTQQRGDQQRELAATA